MQIAAPAPSPAAARQRAALPRGQACDNANRASMAEAGAAGYSVTVAHPAARPAASAQGKSARPLVAVRNFTAAVKANTRHAPTSACAQKMAAYAQNGVARHITMAPNPAATGSQPNRRATKNRHTPASAAGNAAVIAVTMYDSRNTPRGDTGATP